MGILKFSTYKEIVKFTSGIRNRIDLINLLLGILDFNHLFPFDKGDLKIFFSERKSRVFIYDINNPNTIHSFHFPFIIKKEEESFIVIERETFLPEKIDNVVISFFKAIFNNVNYETDVYNKDFLNLFDVFIEIYSEFFGNEGNLIMFWNLYIKLLSFEPGYVRYDYDLLRASASHPLNHLDFNYSKNSTFKIGLKNKITVEDFIDFFENIKVIE